MPTLPLYTPGDHPDASHRVAAPGGYEFWRFEAEGSAADLRLVATLGVGFPPHPDYFRRYARYRRRPTRWPPPLPSEYPCAHLAVYEGGSLLAQFTDHLSPHQFAASAERPSVTAGANALTPEPDGSLSLRLRGVPAPVRGGRRVECLAAQLSFRPLAPIRPLEIALPPSADDDHRWLISNLFCEVVGAVSLSGGADGRGGRDIAVRGRGCHDHGYGTGPLGAGWRRSVRGTLLLRDRAFVFLIAEPRRGPAAPAVRLVEADASGVRDAPAHAAPPPLSDRPNQAAPYPEAIRVAGAGSAELVLQRPRVLESTPSYTRLTYSASVGADAGEALCEVVATPRVSWRTPTPVDVAPARQG